MKDDFLFRFFQTIRSALDIELGLGEYMLLQEAFEKGYDPINTQVVYDLCTRLWLKSENQEEAFRKLFEKEALVEIQMLRKKLQQIQLKQQRVEKKPEEKIEKPQAEEVEERNNPETQKDYAERLEEAAKEEKQKPQYVTEEVKIHFEQNEQLAEDKDHQITYTKQFLMSNNYHPISERDMKQTLRFLRNKIPVGTSKNVDMEGTIDKVAKRAIFENVVFHPRYENKLHLILFIDLGPGMIAFHSLGKQLEKSVVKGGGQANKQVFYFHGAPDDNLLTSRDGTSFIEQKIAFKNLNQSYTNVIIFSDGGASKGEIDQTNTMENWRFIQFLKSKVQHIVWLNPMPKNRWPKSSAEVYAKLVPMYELNKLGFARAIRELRGKKDN